MKDKNDLELSSIQLDATLHSSVKHKLLDIKLSKKQFFNLACHLLVSGSLEKMILEKNAEVKNDN